MYLSQILLTRQDSYEQHQAIWSLFPDAPDRKRDHLFRVEQRSVSQCLALLQSATEPKSSECGKVLASKQFVPAVVNGACYKFKVLAYPTKRIKSTKKIIEIQEASKRVEWLQGKLKGANVTVTSMDSLLVSHKKAFNSRFVCFEGMLLVTNKGQIEQALVMGIGRKKHAGAGLLSLARTS